MDKKKRVDQEVNASVSFILLVIAGTVGFSLAGLVILEMNPLVQIQKFWIMSRASALIAYAILTLVILFGNLLSNPRNKDTWKMSRYLLPWHQALIASMYTLIFVHLFFTVIDPKSGVSFSQMWFPLHAKFTPVAMISGAIGLYFLILIGLTASLRKRFKKWLSIHRISIIIWFFVTFHGFFGGTDTNNFILLYIVSTILVFSTFFMRHWSVKKKIR